MTDRKDAKNLKGLSAAEGLMPQNLAGKKAPVGVQISSSLQGTRNNAAGAVKSGSNMGNSPSKCTLTDMLVSNANLTYSAESSPEKGDLISNWTHQRTTNKTAKTH